MSQDILKYLYYDSGMLFWAETLHNKCKCDALAGTRKQNGYIEIQFKYKRYYAHRLIWELFNGEIPENLVIDHIDGNPSNNCIENLRCVAHVINLHGKRKLTRNTSGYLNVSWHAGYKKWEASVSYKGKRLFREYFNDIQDAATRVKIAKENLWQSST